MEADKHPSFKTMSSVSEETLEEGLDKLFYTYKHWLLASLLGGRISLLSSLAAH